MNYTETLEYLFDALPMFQRIGKQAYKPDLTHIIELCSYLGDPQTKFRSVHIAGTNGKGSTSHMLAAILQQNGYKTGLFTSPHLKDFRERIRINGKMIPKSVVTSFIKKHWVKIDETHPSFFEMTVALAFDWFAEMKVDIAIIETGLGGRLDSTNIIRPILSVITNIGYDHTSILGDKLEQIAAEKAGIIKENIPVIIGEYQPKVAGVFETIAARNRSPLKYASQEWNLTEWQPHLRNQRMILVDDQNHTVKLQLDLPGHYQVKNAKTVLSAIHELNKMGFTIVRPEIALKQVRKLTNLKGRWFILSRNPLTICDTGHNAEGIQEVVTQLSLTRYEKLHLVFGVVNDKDIAPILALLPTHAQYYFCHAAIPRALEAETLRIEAAKYQLVGKAYQSVKEALAAARLAATNNDLIFIGGSTFVVAEIIP